MEEEAPGALNGKQEAVEQDIRPAASFQSAMPAKPLIVLGKRSRRQVNRSTEFLYEQQQPRNLKASRSSLNGPSPLGSASHSHPSSADSMALDVDTDSHALGATSPPSSKKKKKSNKTAANSAALLAEANVNRSRLLQRKAELEAYLKRLQVALAVEQNNAPVPPPEARPSGAHSSNGTISKEKPPAAAMRRKSSVTAKKSQAKVTSAAAPTPPAVDDDLIGPSHKACIQIIDDLLHNQYGGVFAEPVDPVALDLPTYPEVIKNPMDLGTVRERLVSGHYITVSQFIADVQLIWDNAKLFNAAKSFVHDSTLAMEKVWTRKKDTMKRDRRRTLQLPVTPRDQYECIATTSVSLYSTTPMRFFRHAPEPLPSATNAAAHTDNTRVLSFQEKSKLRADIVKVGPSQVEKIVEIVRSSLGPQVNASHEIEIDIEKMSTETLRALQQFVASVLPRTVSRVRAPPSAHATPRRQLSNSMASNNTAVIHTESDSDSSSSSGLDSESSDDEAPAMPPPPPLATGPVDEPVSEPRVELGANMDAWSNLSAADDDGAAIPQTASSSDPLWSDYQNMNAEAVARERERIAEQDRLAQERAELDERARLEREREEQRKVEEAAAREAQRLQQLEEEREMARRALEGDDEDEQEESGAEMGFLTSIFKS